VAGKAHPYNRESRILSVLVVHTPPTYKP